MSCEKSTFFRAAEPHCAHYAYSSGAWWRDLNVRSFEGGGREGLFCYDCSSIRIIRSFVATEEQSQQNWTLYHLLLERIAGACVQN